jgi:hypothetical protein
MQRSASAKLTIRNLDTAIGPRDDWTNTSTTAKLPTTDATDTSQAATLNQLVPRISSQGLREKKIVSVHE